MKPSSSETLAQYFQGQLVADATPQADTALFDVVFDEVTAANGHITIPDLTMRVVHLMHDHRDNLNTHGAGGTTRAGWVAVPNVAPAFADLVTARWPDEDVLLTKTTDLAMALVTAARGRTSQPFLDVFNGMEVVTLPPRKAQHIGHPACLADRRHRFLALMAAHTPLIRATISHVD